MRGMIRHFSWRRSRSSPPRNSLISPDGRSRTCCIASSSRHGLDTSSSPIASARRSTRGSGSTCCPTMSAKRRSSPRTVSFTSIATIERHRRLSRRNLGRPMWFRDTRITHLVPGNGRRRCLPRSVLIRFVVRSSFEPSAGGAASLRCYSGCRGMRRRIADLTESGLDAGVPCHRLRGEQPSTYNPRKQREIFAP